MSRWGRQKHDDTETALANFALTFAKALLVFCVILFVMITDEKKKDDDGIKPKVEAVILVDWAAEAHVDVDTWMKEPQGRVLMYMNKDAGLVFLDRDDLGNKCIKTCEEITSIRGLAAGEYILNINTFSADGVTDGDPLKTPLIVHVKIMKMNPTVQILWESDVVMTYSKQEQHVVRFYITQDTIGNFDSSRPVKLQLPIGK